MLPELQGVWEILNDLHADIKKQLQGLDAAGLNWVPEGEEEVNSLYGIVVHVAAAEMSLAGRSLGERLLPDLPELKTDESIFKSQATSTGRAYELLDQAVGITKGVLERLTPELLGEQRVSPREGSIRSARYWIYHTLDHAATHLGHMELTRQLYLSRDNK